MTSCKSCQRYKTMPIKSTMWSYRKSPNRGNTMYEANIQNSRLSIKKTKNVVYCEAIQNAQNGATPCMRQAYKTHVWVKKKDQSGLMWSYWKSLNRGSTVYESPNRGKMRMTFCKSCQRYKTMPIKSTINEAHMQNSCLSIKQKIACLGYSSTLKVWNGQCLRDLVPLYADRVNPRTVGSPQASGRNAFG